MYHVREPCSKKRPLLAVFVFSLPIAAGGRMMETDSNTLEVQVVFCKKQGNFLFLMTNSNSDGRGRNECVVKLLCVIAQGWMLKMWYMGSNAIIRKIYGLRGI